MCKAGIVLGVSYHNHGSTFLIQFGEEVHHFLSVLGVEITRRLIGQYEFRISDHGTGNGYTLLLTTRELLRIVLGTVTDVHALQHIVHHLLAFGLLDAEVSQREFYVFEHIQFIDEVKALENEADNAFSQAGTLLFLKIGYFGAQELVTAFGRIVKEAKGIEQS